MRWSSRTRTWRRFAAAAIVALLPVIVALASAPAVLAVQKVIVSPSNGVAGATVKATASGFPVGPIEFWWDGATLLGTAAGDGRATLSFQIPAGASIGSHTVRACFGTGCPTGGTFDDTKVNVVAPTPPPPTPTPVPTPTPTPTAPPTPRPTPTRTPVATPAPPGQTPRPTPVPTLRPGQTPLPTPVSTLPNPSPVVASPDASPSAAASPSAGASPVPSDGPAAGPSATPFVGSLDQATPPTLQPAAPTSASGLPGVLAMIIAGVGVILLAAAFIALWRGRRPAAAGASSASPNALPTSWGISSGDAEAEAMLAAAAPVVPSMPATTPVPPARPEPVAAVEPTPWPAADEAPRQRTIVVHVTPKDSPQETPQG